MVPNRSNLLKISPPTHAIRRYRAISLHLEFLYIFGDLGLEIFLRKHQKFDSCCASRKWFEAGPQLCKGEAKAIDFRTTQSAVHPINNSQQHQKLNASFYPTSESIFSVFRKNEIRSREILLKLKFNWEKRGNRCTDDARARTFPECDPFAPHYILFHLGIRKSSLACCSLLCCLHQRNQIEREEEKKRKMFAGALGACAATRTRSGRHRC